MSKRRLVVIGANPAGMSAASQARRRDPELQVTVFDKGEWISYSACGLPYLVGGLVSGPDALVARTPQQFAKQGIEVKLRHMVHRINTAEQLVYVVDENGNEHREGYDVLMLATGAHSIQPKVDGLNLKGVFNLYRMPDALALQQFIAQERPRRAVIVGGGYIGLEMAENLHRLGLNLALVERSPKLFASLDDGMSAKIAKELERHNVDLSLGDSVLTACCGGDRVQIVQTQEGGEIQADLVLLSVGVRPNVQLAHEAGIHIGETGAIAVDEHQRTSVPNVYAAGDCAEHFHRIIGKPAWMPLGTTANKQGRVAGDNIGGGSERFRGILGTAITRVFDLEVGITGLGEQQAEQAGIPSVGAKVESTDVAGYYPDAAPLYVKLFAEQRTGKLIGAQAAGKGVDKRIDVVATALHAGLTADELAWVDLEYAPPFNSVWDPLHIAARKLAEQIKN
jgi:NADPH-dependent 2,4-dienoyl-CoA reductase/sulfur reductase-like enzyme